jgi:tetratricopeptide (TPR) repeat protein
MEQPRKAISLLQTILEDRYDENVLNILCELHLHVKEYEDCLKLFTNFSDRKFPLDIEVKRAIALMRCGSKYEGMPVFEKLLGNSVMHYPDLYYLAGCLFYDLAEYEFSLKFFESLRVLDTYDKPELWLKCGELYCKIKDFTSAQDALTSVLQAEQKELHTEAKLKLAQLYRDSGDINRSIELLHSVNLPHADNLDHEILTQVAQNDILLKIEEVEILLDQNSNLHEVLEFLRYIIDIENKSQITLKHEGVVKFIGEIRFNHIVIKCIDLLMNLKDYEEAKKLIKNLLSISACKREDVRFYLKQRLTRCCIEVNEYEEALNAFKFICEKNDTEENWVILNSIAKKCSNHSQLRGWLSKISTRKPNNRSIRMLLGNNYLQTGYFTLAIKQYGSLYEEDNENSLVNLDLGLCYLLSLGSRTSQNKTGLYNKAFFHIKKYVRVRKKTHYTEAYFNLGRAYHHLSYIHKAKHYYDKVLTFVARHLMYCGETATYSLHLKYAKRSAYNLVSIYKSLNEASKAAEIAESWL